MRTLLIPLGCLLAAATARTQVDPAYRDVDYPKLERRIAKHPEWVAAPRFALFVFDLAGTHRVWAVADKSSAAAEYYDVLYLDLDGDGDVTSTEERFVGKVNPKAAAAGMAMAIRVGDVPVPGTDLVHKDFLVSTSPKAGRSGFWFRMKWNGQTEMSGGYSLAGIDTTVWGDAPKTAPVFRPCPDAPLHFATWGEAELTLTAGGEAHINVVAGNRGSGPNTLAVVDERFLDLTLEELTVTVIAQDKHGERVSLTSRIQEHC